MSLVIKAGLGAVVVVLISLLTRSKSYYIAGLIPFFPTFTLIAHYIVGKERPVQELKTTILLSIGGLIPLLVYLVAVYVLVDHTRLEAALSYASLLWCVAAFILIASFKGYFL